RVALATDMTTVALSSSSGLTVRRSSSEKEQILNGDLTAEVRLPSTPTTAAPTVSSPSVSPDAVNAAPPVVTAYRVEIVTFTDAQKAQAATATIKKRFDQTAATAYDKQTGEYRVVTGKYTSKVQALDMLAIFKEAGFTNARLVANESVTIDKMPAPVASATAT